jgi:tetratricopeptide (TPR) repeat protein
LEADMSPDQAPSKIGKSVGERLRAARIAHHYTQGQLAAPDFSVSYISAIERGQIHPSLRALEILATRLGIASTQLLPSRAQTDTHLATSGPSEREENEEDLLLLEMQVAIHQGAADHAVATLEKMPVKRLSRPQLLRHHYLLGWAYLETEHLHECQQMLTEATELAKELNDTDMHLRSLYLLGRAYAGMHNYTQAIISHQHCLHLMQEMPSPDTYFQAQVYLSLGQHYLAQDNTKHAQEMFQAALSLTSTLSTAQAAREYYRERSQLHAGANQYELAERAAYKSLHLYALTDSTLKRSEIHYYLGQALLKKDLAEADAYLTQALHQPGIQQDPLSLASVNLYKAKWHMERQEYNEAAHYSQQAQNLVRDQGDSLIAADILLTAGQVDYMLGHYDDADTHFVAGLQMLEHIGLQEELANQAVRYARLLEQRGKEHEALTYFKLAFQSGQKIGK